MPVILTSATPTLICVGETSTLSANGALTYSWNPPIALNGIISPTATITYSVAGTDSLNCTSTPAVITVSVDLCAGLSNLVLTKEQVRIYPNPTSSSFIIELNKPVEIIIYNSLGQIIYKEMSHELRSEISLVNFTNGIYFIKAGSTLQKIIKI